MGLVGDPSTEALLEAVRAQFAASLPDKAASIAALVARGTWDEARRAAHRLRGSAGTYGFAEIGAAAGAIEDLLLAQLAGASEPDAAGREHLEGLLRDLASKAGGAP